MAEEKDKIEYVDWVDLLPVAVVIFLFLCMM